MHISWTRGAQLAFVDCNTVSFEFDDEKSIDHCKRSLAKVLFKRFVPERMHRRFGYTLVDVLERIKVDTGTTLVMLQVDEYSKNQTLARALIRACRETFRLGPTMRGGICAGVLVVPMLSGIPFVNLRSSLVETSPRTQAFFVSLAGITDEKSLAKLEMSFYKAARVPVPRDRSGWQLLTSSFGGFPRLFTWCVEVLGARENARINTLLQNGAELDLDTAKMLYDGVLKRYQEAYKMQIWVDAFRSDPTKVGSTRWSEPTYKSAMEHLKRVHTLAVAGERVDVGSRVWRGDVTHMHVQKTFQELSATGLFSLQTDDTGHGVIVVPLLALDAFATNSSADAAFAPLEYSWADMELVALYTMRCRWNAIWYTKGDQWIPISALRPGAFSNPSSSFPQVFINCELGPLVRLGQPLQGDMSSELRTGSDGRGPHTTIKSRVVYLTCQGQAGVDGVAHLGSAVWLSQTKSSDLITRSGAPSRRSITQGQVQDDIVAKMVAAASKFNFGGNRVFVFDVFTNRVKGARLDLASLPVNVLLTTRENYDEVVGPVFKGTIRLFDRQ